MKLTPIKRQQKVDLENEHETNTNQKTEECRSSK